jgi:hypothetical protein
VADVQWHQPQAWVLADAETPMLARAIRQGYHPALWARYLGPDWNREYREEHAGESSSDDA